MLLEERVKFQISKIINSKDREVPGFSSDSKRQKPAQNKDLIVNLLLATPTWSEIACPSQSAPGKHNQENIPQAFAHLVGFSNKYIGHVW